MSYWHQPGEEPLLQLTIGNLIDNAAKKWETRPAIISVHQGYTLTFGEVKQQVDQFSQGLLNLGLLPGDILGLWGVNTKEWYLTLLAAAKVGIIVVTINPTYQSQELAYCLKKTAVNVLAMDESYKSQHNYKIITKLIPEVLNSNPRASINSKEFPLLSHLIVFTQKELMGAFNFNDTLEAGVGFEEQRIAAENDFQSKSIWNLQFTSGSTSYPKAVPLSHFSHINNAYFFGKHLEFHSKKHIICCQVPFFHTFGCVFGVLAPLIFGTTIVLPGAKFKSEESLKAIKNHKCTVLYGTPTMYVDICEDIMKITNGKLDMTDDYASLEIALIGGAMCTPEHLISFKNELKCKFIPMYGMTETSGIVCMASSKTTKMQLTTTVGQVLDYYEVKVVDNKGEIIPLGEQGELWVRSYGVMEKYWEDEEKTNKIKTEDGWLMTGDQFIMHEDGHLQIVGRIKDIIIRGGENISPVEIENLLETIPGVNEAQVYGVSCERLGEEVACSIKFKEETNISKDDVKTFCSGKIAHFKIPKYIEFVSQFPTTASGKVKKFELKKMMEEKIKSGIL